MTVYKPGASAELGSSGDPGTFGVARLKDRVRIVWHFASDSLRTFTIAYRFRGLAVAYDDVVDVNMQVWGKQWPKGVSLGRRLDRAADDARRRAARPAARLGPSRHRERHGRPRRRAPRCSRRRT